MLIEEQYQKQRKKKGQCTRMWNPAGVIDNPKGVAGV
jgi:hypothetical protein